MHLFWFRFPIVTRGNSQALKPKAGENRLAFRTGIHVKVTVSTLKSLPGAGSQQAMIVSPVAVLRPGGTAVQPDEYFRDEIE